MTEQENILNQIEAIEKRITEVKERDASSYKRLYTLTLLRRNLLDQLNHYGTFVPNESRLVSRSTKLKNWRWGNYDYDMGQSR